VSVDHPIADKSYAAENESVDSQFAANSGNAEDTDHGPTDSLVLGTSDGNPIESRSAGGYYYLNFVLAFSSSDPDSCTYYPAQWHGSLELGR